MLNLQMFRLIHKVPGATVTPLTRADVMEQFPITLSKSAKRTYSDTLFNAVESAIKSAKSINRDDLMKTLAMGSVRMGSMSVTTGIARLRLIGAVRVELCKVAGNGRIIYHYVPE